MVSGLLGDLLAQCSSQGDTFPPFCGRRVMTCLWSQTFIAAESSVLPV
jgi:hypothetical protein